MKRILALGALLFSTAQSMEPNLSSLSEDNPCTSAFKPGYKPAHPNVISANRDLENMRCMKFKAFSIPKTVQISDGKIIELANIKNWPRNLVYDQGDLGSCTANSAAFIIRQQTIATSKKPDQLIDNPEMLNISRLYQYWNTRYYESKIQKMDYNMHALQDTGGSMAGALLALDKYGCCPENMIFQEESIDTPDISGSFSYEGWSYDVRNFAKQPDPESYRFALDYDLDGLNPGGEYSKYLKRKNPYARVSCTIQYKDITSKYRKTNMNILNSESEKNEFFEKIDTSLAQNRPIYLGIMLDDEFMKTQHNKGFFRYPGDKKDEYIKNIRFTGGHAMALVGHGFYNDNDPKQKYFKIINSYGPNWGDNGFIYLDEDYIGNVNRFAIEAFSVWLNPLS